MDTHQIFCAEQIEVPKELPGLIKGYAKEVIRFQPDNIVEFSRDYFTHMANGTLSEWLRKQEEIHAKKQAERK